MPLVFSSDRARFNCSFVTIAPVKSVSVKSAQSKLESVNCALLSLADVRSAPKKLVPVKFDELKLTLLKFESLNLHCIIDAFVKVAFDRFAKSKFAETTTV
jgi:hypothetical protein